MVNKLSMEKYDIIWMSNGDIYRMKKELSSQLWNKVGKIHEGFHEMRYCLVDSVTLY